MIIFDFGKIINFVKNLKMDQLLKVIDDDNVKVASSQKDSRGRHRNLDKEALKANLKSKQQLEEISRLLAVRIGKCGNLLFALFSNFWFLFRASLMMKLRNGFWRKKALRTLVTGTRISMWLCRFILR